MVPERFGGMGLGFVELAILLEQSGRFLLGSPLFATACLATPALLLGHNAALQEHWLSAIAAGETRATLAFASGKGWMHAVCKRSPEPRPAAVTLTAFTPRSSMAHKRTC